MERRVQCPRCAHDSRPVAKFCAECGQAVGRPGQSRFSSPTVYTPKHLAEKIITSKAALEGERNRVTVLFADLGVVYVHGVPAVTRRDEKAAA